MDSEYRQSMSAVVCVYPSGWVEILSMHRHAEDAGAELRRLLETERGKALADEGTLVTVGDAHCGVEGVIDQEGLLKMLDRNGVDYRNTTSWHMFAF